MKCNDAGLALIRRYESLRLEAYLCPAKIPTIGYGHTGPDVELGMTISQDRAEELFESDVARFERGIEAAVSVPLNENQLSALVSLAFNIGLEQFDASTLLRELNAGHYDEANLHFQDWVNVAHRGLLGLVDRRADEMALFSQSA